LLFNYLLTCVLCHNMSTSNQQTSSAWIQDQSSKITPTREHRAKSLRWRKHLLKFILKETDSNQFMLTGSYSRHTDLVPIKGTDTDIMLLLTANNTDAKQEINAANLVESYVTHVIKAVKQAGLQDRFVVRQQSKSIGLIETGDSSATNPVNFDVVLGKRLPDGYKIADRKNDKWISTDPKKVRASLIVAQQASKCGLHQFIRLLKFWNNKSGNLLKSIHIEVMMYSFRPTCKRRLNQLLLAAFEHLYEMVPKGCVVPGSEASGPIRVKPHVKLVALARLKQAVSLASQACKSGVSHQNAISLWEKVFL